MSGYFGGIGIDKVDTRITNPVVQFWTWMRDLDVNGDSRWHLPFGGRRNKVSGIVKMELLDRRKPRYTIRAEHEVQCFAHRALADIVRAGHEAVAIEMNLGSLDAPKIHDLQANYFHCYAPVVRSD